MLEPPLYLDCVQTFVSGLGQYDAGLILRFLWVEPEADGRPRPNAALFRQLFSSLDSSFQKRTQVLLLDQCFSPHADKFRLFHPTEMDEELSEDDLDILLIAVFKSAMHSMAAWLRAMILGASAPVLRAAAWLASQTNKPGTPKRRLVANALFAKVAASQEPDSVFTIMTTERASLVDLVVDAIVEAVETVAINSAPAAGVGGAKCTVWDGHTHGAAHNSSPAVPPPAASVTAHQLFGFPPSCALDTGAIHAPNATGTACRPALPGPSVSRGPLGPGDHAPGVNGPVVPVVAVHPPPTAGPTTASACKGAGADSARGSFLREQAQVCPLAPPVLARPPCDGGRSREPASHGECRERESGEVEAHQRRTLGTTVQVRESSQLWEDLETLRGTIMEFVQVVAGKHGVETPARLCGQVGCSTADEFSGTTPG